MSGNEQHYIPRMLLRKFEAVSSCRKQHVYSYHKHYPVRLKAIRGVASRLHFYSENKKGSLDDLITGYENRLLSIFKRISCCGDGQCADVDDAAEYVAHLSVRVDHFRSVMARAVVSLVSIATKEICRDGVLEAFLVNEDGSPKEILKNEIAEFIKRKEVDLPPFPDDLLGRIVMEFFFEKRPALMADISVQFEKMSDCLEDKAAEAAEGAHKRVLGMSLAPQVRAKGLRRLHWVVLESLKDVYILPDCVAICLKDERSDPSPLLYENSESLKCVMTPLSPRKLLVGYSDEVPLGIGGIFNELAAKCSESFFVSSYESDGLSLMRGYIGKRSSSVIDEQVISAVESTLASRAGHAEGQSCERVEPGVAGEFECIFLFEGVAEEERGEIVRAVGEVVSAFFSAYDISSLGAITFFTEYEGRPHAYIVSEINDETLRISIFAHADVARELVGGGSERRLVSLYTLVFLLARIAARGMVCSMFPRFKTGVVFGNLYDGMLSSMYSAWEGYFSARISARLNPAIGGDYASAARQALVRAAHDIYAARLRFHETRDFEVFYSVLFNRTSEFLEKLGFFLGHLDGVKEVKDASVSFARLGLHEYDLYEWGILLAKEFSVVYENYGVWRGEHVFRNLVVKMDRVYWAFKVFILERDGNINYYML
ncbi:DUF4238 domain-containing protein [Nitratidesulfovibrio termitidis]|uniref:DUF4238 domain-containing protein n=1 Tax=Nitratidesulfovibrio termitidis TaxID=42252 RepID=UPI0004201EBB|nr:DUF4238 domain-containing protein [Nitratidesulfovibrio termitidis]